MIDMESTIYAAKELTVGKAPNVKLALWAGIMSINESLERNGRAVNLLRRFVSSPLPESREDLFTYLKQGCLFLTGVKIKALYVVEDLERTGKLNGLEHIGIGYIEQCLWREKVYGLMHGNGMSYKTISFAALLLDPLHCELVPVDRWVMFRLHGTWNSPQRYKQYLEVEREVQAERDREAPGIPTGLVHWLKWDETRIAHSSAYKGNGQVESHAALSPRIY